MLPSLSPDLASSLAMLAAFALLIAGGWLIKRGRDRKRGVLMIIMAIVLIANVVLWIPIAH